MPEDVTTNNKETNHGWRVALAGLGINLALGVLYSWSIISGAIKDAGWGWSADDLSLPYSVACLVFCFIMVPAGRMQDKLSPRLVASIGGILVGLGMIFASQTQSVMGYVIGFGVLAGAGIGCGYASATPPAVKWFPPAKTGLIAGIVVSGFGLASLYAAPLAKWLTDTYSLRAMMMTLGIAFLVIVVSLAQLLKPPHKALQFIKGLGKAGEEMKEKKAEEKPDHVKKEDFLPSEMLKTWQFYVIWFMFACGAGAGLMVISAAKGIVKNAGSGDIVIAGKTMGVGVIAVMALAIGNGGGRVLAGLISDKLGRNLTLFFFLVLQAIAIFILSIASAEGSKLAVAPVLIGVSMLVGANYGSNLALFPSMTKDFFGLKNFGMNYGLVFTAWGVGGFILAQFAAKVYAGKIVAAWAGSYKFAFYTSIALLAIAGIMTFILKSPKHKKA